MARCTVWCRTCAGWTCTTFISIYGIIRFRSCRWQQPAENGNSEFCTHREVKPYAGTTGFDADAWCPDCQYYKLRRAPKKRERDEYTY